MSTTPDEPFDPLEATVGELHAAIEAGTVTAASLVARYLARIDAYDDDLAAILTVNDDAARRAERLDERFADEGFVGPLHGIPVVLKDNHATGDLPTTAGSAALSELVPPRDAFVVEQLREAGAVVLAKANLQELSYGVDTISSLGGATRNPYDLGRRPSGSSGGTAAAVAANLGAVGTGSDTCSSVRSPPAFCGLVGVRPTRGLVSRTGIVPLSERQDTAGPITRTVADAARLLEVMAGYDPDDPVTARGAGRVPEEGYLPHLDESGLEGARVGVVRSFFGLQDEDSASPAAADAVTGVIEAAIDEMAAAGATVVDPVEVADRSLLESARVLEFEFRREFDRFLEEWAPDAPYGTLAELLDSGQVAPTVADRIAEGAILDVDVDTLEGNAAYLRRLERRRRLAVDTERRLVERDLDALVYPPSTITPVEIPANQPFEELHCELAAHTGFPAIVVPAGVTDDGLPVGVEFLARPFAEPRLFELAHSFERATEHRQPPAGFGPLE